MATIENIITGGEYDIIEVASSPAAGAGTKSPLGSLAIVQDVGGSTAQLWQKTGLADTAWVQIANSTTGSVAWSLVGNAGTNAGVNFLGTTDAVDFVYRTTNLERMRILAGGSVITGATASAIYRTTNTGSDEVAHLVIDPANSLTSGNSYTFDSTEFGLARANGTRRIQRAAFMLSNLVDTAGAETGGLGIYTKPSTGAITERIRILPTGEVGIGTATPTSLFSVGSSSQFQVNSSGNIVRTRNLPTSWPTIQGNPGTVLTNDGSGNFSWLAAIVTINPRYSSYGLDDFTNSDGGSDIGQLSWNTNANIPTPLPGEAGHPGIWRMSVTGSGSVSAVDLELASILPSNNQIIVMQTLVRIPALSTSTQEFTFIFGMMSSVTGTGAPANAVTIVYERASSVNWRAVTTNASVSTTTNSAIPVVAGAWVYLEIELTNNTSVVYKVDGNVIATHTTNIPASVIGMAYKTSKTVGSTTTRSVDLDVFNYFMTLNR